MTVSELQELAKPLLPGERLVPAGNEGAIHVRNELPYDQSLISPYLEIGDWKKPPKPFVILGLK